MLIFRHRLLCSGGIDGGHFNYPAGVQGGARYNWFTYSPEDTFVWNEEAGSYGIGKENGKSGRGSASLVILHLLNRAWWHLQTQMHACTDFDMLCFTIGVIA